MPSVTFKLMGIIGDKSEKQILIDSELFLKDVKVIVRKAFMLIPNANISFLHNGKRFNEDNIPFKRIPLDPRKEKITVIVSNPNY